jgi:hypothetical protein
MGQASLFSRAQISAMRDHTASRNYCAARDEFRREHERHRAWGLQRRHAEKLRRLRQGGTPTSRPSSVPEPTPPPAAPTGQQAAPSSASRSAVAAAPPAVNTPTPAPTAERPTAPGPTPAPPQPPGLGAAPTPPQLGPRPAPPQSGSPRVRTSTLPAEATSLRLPTGISTGPATSPRPHTGISTGPGTSPRPGSGDRTAGGNRSGAGVHAGTACNSRIDSEPEAIGNRGSATSDEHSGTRTAPTWPVAPRSATGRSRMAVALARLRGPRPQPDLAPCVTPQSEQIRSGTFRLSAGFPGWGAMVLRTVSSRPEHPAARSDRPPLPATRSDQPYFQPRDPTGPCFDRLIVGISWLLWFRKRVAQAALDACESTCITQITRWWTREPDSN